MDINVADATRLREIADEIVFNDTKEFLEGLADRIEFDELDDEWLEDDERISDMFVDDM